MVSPMGMLSMADKRIGMAMGEKGGSIDNMRANATLGVFVRRVICSKLKALILRKAIGQKTDM